MCMFVYLFFMKVEILVFKLVIFLFLVCKFLVNFF